MVTEQGKHLVNADPVADFNPCHTATAAASNFDQAFLHNQLGRDQTDIAMAMISKR